MPLALMPLSTLLLPSNSRGHHRKLLIVKTELTDQIQSLQAIADKQQAEQIALAEAEKEQQRRVQIQDGSCNIVPFPKKNRTKPFRSELTIEQNSLFVANRYKGESFVREWEIVDPETKEVLQKRVTIGKVTKRGKARGVLKQHHQDVFYRLMQLWAGQGYNLRELKKEPHGTIKISAYDLVTSIRGNNSADHYERVQELLQDMVSIPVVVETEYLSKDEKDRFQFTLLGDVHWDGKKLDRKTLRPKPGGRSEVTIQFSSMVTEGFLAKHVKTLLGGPYRALGSPKRGGRGELARLLYPYLDAQLATKTNFHIKLQALAERFGLTQHSKMSYRKRQFTPAVNALNGKPIKSEDHVLRVHLRESTEEDDYILVAKREPNRQLRLFKEDKE